MRRSISPQKECRPGALEMAAFLEEALRRRARRVCALTTAGEKVDDWHWVTLVTLEYGEEGVFADVTDEGRHFRVDLGLWLSTTKRGGASCASCRAGMNRRITASFARPNRARGDRRRG